LLRVLLKSKIHCATVTDADINYEGSITIDENLLEAADILPYEKVHLYDVTNGARLETYAIVGERGSGEICVNGAAANLVKKNDIIIIASYVMVYEEELKNHKPKLVYVNEKNEIKKVS
jgi:aspartate 1-decarboxylase